MTCTAISEASRGTVLSLDVPVECISAAPELVGRDKPVEVARAALAAAVDAGHTASHAHKPIKASVHHTADTAQKSKEATVSVAQDVQAYFKARKEKMVQRLEAWKKDYDPAPGFPYSWLPNMSKIVHIESFDVLEAFVAGVSHATTREKIDSILKKNVQIMKDSMFCMNAATVAKMTEGCKIIEHERKMLGCPERAPKKPEEKKPRVVALDDPLFSQKSRLMKKLEEWRKDFDPQPQCLLACLPGIVDSLSTKAKRLFDGLYKGVVKVEKEKFTKFLESHRDLILSYSSFVNSLTAAKLAAVCEILSLEIDEAKARA